MMGMAKCEDFIHRFVCETLRGRIENTWAETCVAYRHKRSCADVVLCKECKHWNHMGDGIGDCTNGRFHLEDCPDPTMTAEEFCCLGERKDND